jgi:hypothetical protein
MFPSLRLNNIFRNLYNGQAPIGADSPFIDPNIPSPDIGGVIPDMSIPPTNIPTQDFDPYAGFTPEHEMTDYFNNLVRNMPVRRNPSLLRKIGASLVSAGQGIKAGERALFAPYLQELEDWQEKLKPAYQAANLERFENVNQRNLAYQRGTLAEKERAARAKEDIARFRAQAYDFKARNPNWRMVAEPDTLDAEGNTVPGKVWAINPQFPDRKVDTGLHSKDLSELDKVNLQIEGGIARVEEAGKQARETEGVRQKGRMAVEAERTRRAREVAGIRSGAKGAGSKPELPTQTKVRQYNAARELANTDSEARKWIKLGKPGTNDFSITPPASHLGGMFTTGPTEEQYRKISQAIYGTPISPTEQAKAQTPQSKTGEPPSAGKAPDGEDLVEVINPSGQRKRIRKSQLQQALDNGYTVP